MTTLPKLQHELRQAARRQSQRRRWLRTPSVPAVLLVVVLTITAGATAASVLMIDRGASSRGDFSITRLPDHDGRVCLQLEDEDRRPAYGCGAAPSDDKPFGLVVADSRSKSERIIYGLVSSRAIRVRVFGDGSEYTDARPVPRSDLPGKYFRVIVANRGRIELAAYGPDDREIEHIGTRQPPQQPPRLRADAVAQGDPSGFAPTVAPLSSFRYGTGTISPDEAARRHLACVEDERGGRCFDTEAMLEAAERSAGARQPTDSDR